MAEPNNKTDELSAGRRRLRSFRPLFYWLIGSTLLLAWDYHRKHAPLVAVQFSVRIEGEVPDDAYSARLNGVPFSPGKQAGLGWNTLEVKAPEIEPFQTNVFVWYGGKKLGEIPLVRSRGSLTLKVAPLARVSIRGKHFHETFENVGTTNLSVPVGDYHVVAEFLRFSGRKEVAVRRKETSVVEIKPGVVNLAVDAEPGPASFELTSITQGNISMTRLTPIVVGDLPVGEYHLRFWQGEYIKQTNITLHVTEPTNSLKLIFEYGKVGFIAEPAGSSVYDGDKEIGQTPLTLTNVIPGTHVFQFTSDGYRGTNLTVLVNANELISVQVSLINLRYTEAMDNAAAKAFADRDYEGAVIHIQTALEIKPSDEAALKLKREIEFKLHLEKARNLGQERKFDLALSEIGAALKLKPGDGVASQAKVELEQAKESAERESRQARDQARRQHPKNVFTTANNEMTNNELFESELIKVNGNLNKVRESILSALNSQPKWDVTADSNPDGETFRINAGTKNLFSKKNILIVGGQASDEQVYVYFKIFEYSLGNKISLNFTEGVSDSSYLPYHPQYFPNDSQVAEKRSQTIREMRERIQKQLQTP